MNMGQMAFCMMKGLELHIAKCARLCTIRQCLDRLRVRRVCHHHTGCMVSEGFIPLIG